MTLNAQEIEATALKVWHLLPTVKVDMGNWMILQSA